MTTMDLLFDVSVHRYPKYHGGLRELTEQVTLSNFNSTFEWLNYNVRFNAEQLRDCWFYALDQEYQKIMTNKKNMTEEEIEMTEELLSQGVQQGTMFTWRGADWDVAEYSPDGKTPKVTLKSQCRSPKDRLPGKPQLYDPLLLLQSMPEIRAQAERFYQDGLEKFLSQGLRAQDPAVLKSYKSSCVGQAEEYIKCLLIDNYQKGEQAAGAQMTQYEESKVRDPSLQYDWKRDPKWEPVWTQIKAARKQLVSEVGTTPLIEQDANIDTGDNIKNLNSGINSSQMALPRISAVSGLSRTVDAAEYRRLLRRIRRKIVHEKVRTVEGAKISKRSEQLERKQLRLAKGKQRFTGLESSLESLSITPAKEVLNLVKQKRKKRKVASRIEEKIGARLLAHMDNIFLTKKYPPFFSDSAHPADMVGDSGNVRFPIKQERMQSGMVPTLGNNSTAAQNLLSPSTGSGSILRSPRSPLGAEIKAEDQNFPPNPLSWERFTETTTPMGPAKVRSMTAKRNAKATTIRAETRNVPSLKGKQADRDLSEMDVEISRSIANLKIKI